MVIVLPEFARVTLTTVTGRESDFIGLPNDVISIPDDIELVRIFFFKNLYRDISIKNKKDKL